MSFPGLSLFSPCSVRPFCGKVELSAVLSSGGLRLIFPAGIQQTNLAILSRPSLGVRVGGQGPWAQSKAQPLLTSVLVEPGARKVYTSNTGRKERSLKVEWEAASTWGGQVQGSARGWDP